MCTSRDSRSAARTSGALQGVIGTMAVIAVVIVLGSQDTCAQTIPPGYDLFETTVGATRVHIGGASQIPEIPAGFFFDGSEAWSGAIELRGDPLPGYCGAVNTVLERKEEAVMPGPATVEVELKGLSLASVDPIYVTDGGGGGGGAYYDVEITVSPDTPSTGHITIMETDASGGTYSFKVTDPLGGGVYVYVRFNFFEAWPSRAESPPPIVWDPPDPLLLENAGSPQWQYAVPPEPCIIGNDFYHVPGLTLQTVLDNGDSGEHECGGPGPVDGCCLPCGTCIEVDPVDCGLLGGTPQGGPCAYEIVACCLGDGTCVEVDLVCCDDMGGIPSPTGQPACLGDANANGIDDACEPTAVVIPVGECYFETTVGSSRVHIGGTSVIPEIPADFFFQGSQPWSGTIELRGDPLPDQAGATSVVFERKEAAVMPGPATIEVELKELSLVSVDPIVVTDGIGGEYLYVMKMHHDMAMASTGQMTVEETVADGGGIYSFNSASGGGIYLNVLLSFFEAWPSRNGDPIILDPPPLLLESVGSGTWQYERPVIAGESGNDFYPVPGEELLTVIDAGLSGEHGVIPPRDVEACCLQGGVCIVADPADCAAMGGNRSPTGAQTCLGDGDGDGADDACEPPEVIPLGDMYLETVAGTSWVEFGGDSGVPPIPADMFFPGSQPFEGVISLEASNTVDWEEVKPYEWPRIRRLESVELSSGSATVEVALKELTLVSRDPITILDDNDPPVGTEYHVYVTLNDNPGYESTGAMLIVSTDDYGGLYYLDSAHGGGIHLYARFNFFEAWPSRNGETISWDLLDPLLLETTDAEPWQYDGRHQDWIEVLSIPGGASMPNIYPIPGEDIHVVLDGGTTGEHGVIPPREWECCCLPDGTCFDTCPEDCMTLGGIPQGVPCTGMTIACCFDAIPPIPDCVTVEMLCCDDMGGEPSPTGEPACLGDGFPPNGIDDACEVPTVIPIGTDYWETTVGSTQIIVGGASMIPPIPADLFFPGSQPYEGIIPLEGSPWQTGEIYQVDTDAVVARQEQADLSGGPATIQIELIDLDLVSTAPIIITDGGGGIYYYDVEITVNPDLPSTGYMTITSTDSSGGTFEFDSDSGGGIYVYARFNFFEAWPSREPIVWDPPDPLLLESVRPHPWQYADPHLIDNPDNDFYAPPGQELEAELDGGASGFHGVIPSRPIEACCYDDGTCQNLVAAYCVASEGTPVGPGTNCDIVGCRVHTQACCYSNGTCQDEVAADCAANGGTPLGPDTACVGDADSDGFDDLCEVACCLHDGVSCLTTSLDWCLIGWEGQSMGYCTHCLGDGDMDAYDDACQAVVINPGRDYWATLSPTNVTLGMGGPLPPIPADFFFSGSLPWEGTIDLMGEPLDPPNLGNAASGVQRNCTGLLAQPSYSDSIEIELVQMQLKSITPIAVSDIGSPDSVYYDVTVTLDPDKPSTGEMTVTSTSPDGDNGVYRDVMIVVYPVFGFTPAGGGGSGESAYAPEEELVLQGSGPYPWQATPLLDPPMTDSGPNFYPTDLMELELVVPGPVPIPVGVHSNEPPGWGCCLPGGVCIDIEPDQCVGMGGIPQQTPCAGTITTCCLDPSMEPDCVDVDPVCCDEEGGAPPPTHEPVCLGDANGNGQDDACEPAVVVPVGLDHFETTAGSSWVKFGGESSVPPIPADFFFVGSQPYEGIVELRGDPLPEACSAVDTIVERKEEADLTNGSAMVEVELVELSLVSVAPITVTDDQRNEYEYDIEVTINPDIPSVGQMLVVGTDADGGVYEMNSAQGGGIYIYARFNFFEAWPSRQPPIVWDPPDPLLLESVTTQDYQYETPPITCMPGNDFYSVPEQVLFTILDGGITGEHGVIPPRIPDGCCLPNGDCVDIDPGDCVILGGTPQGMLCTQTTIACCLDPTQDPDCMTIDPICCDDQNGQPSAGGEPACLGDVSPQNGVDDACEGLCEPDITHQACEPVVCPVPTDECVPVLVQRNLPGPLFPLGDIDVLRGTTGYIEIEDPTGLPEIYTIDGHEEPNITRVSRGNPEDAGDHREIQTEIIEMELVAGGAGGSIAIHLSTTQPSLGHIEGAGDPGTDFPADSFFDVYVTVDLLDLPGAEGLWHADPIPLMSRDDYSVPPWGSALETPFGTWPGTELLDQLGDPTGYWIRYVSHVLPPPPPPWEVIVCDCLPPNACHVEFDEVNDEAHCVDVCPPGEVCNLIGTDTNGDGADDTFECVCEPAPVGACCFDDYSCMELIEVDCLALNGIYQGDNTVCDGMEACCLPIGRGTGCVDADALCCVNQLGGLPQGPGTTCTDDQACCLPGGGCMNLDPLCCVSDMGGTPLGPGTQCTVEEACCMFPECFMLDPLCCYHLDGIPVGPGSQCTEPEACCTESSECLYDDPLCCGLIMGMTQGPGTFCSQPVACCRPNGACDEYDPVCCDDTGGTLSPIGSEVCLGDGNGNGADDACEFAQPPDPEPGPPCDTAADCTGLYEGADCVAGMCYVPKNRYLSIDPTTNVDPVAYQIEIVEASVKECTNTAVRCVNDLDCEPGQTCEPLYRPGAAGRTWWMGDPVCYDYPDGNPVPGALTCEGPDYFGWVSMLRPRCLGGTSDRRPCESPPVCMGGTTPGAPCTADSDCPSYYECQAGNGEWTGVACTPPGPECQEGEDCNLQLPGFCLSCPGGLCVADVPVPRIWTEIPVHVTGCPVAPVITYAIRASADGMSFSEPLVINTIHAPAVPQNWGDLTGGPEPGQPPWTGRWLPPNRSASMADIQAAIRTFQNQEEETGFPPRVWAETEINQVVNMGDIQFLLMAFAGRDFATIGLPLIGLDPVLCPPSMGRLGSYGNSGCLPGTRSDGRATRSGWCDDDVVQFTVGPGTLEMLHHNAEYNCCPDDIAVSLSVEGNVIRLREQEIFEEPCYCICCYDVEATVVNLVPGSYTVELCWLEPGDPPQETCYQTEVVIP